MTNFNDVTVALDGWLQTITGNRSTGSYVNGRWVESYSVISFSAVVQNASPKDLLVLEEGMRTEETIKLHTTFELVSQVDGVSNGDKLTYLGSTYQVYNVANRQIGGYYKALAIRQP